MQLLRPFEYFILTVIVVNSTVMAMYDYSDRDSLTFRNKTLDFINSMLTFVFLVEALMKIVAYGFIMGKRGYLRDSWNLIDFSVVFFGYALK